MRALDILIRLLDTNRGAIVWKLLQAGAELQVDLGLAAVVIDAVRNAKPAPASAAPTAPAASAAATQEPSAAAAATSGTFC